CGMSGSYNARRMLRFSSPSGPSAVVRSPHLAAAKCARGTCAKLPSHCPCDSLVCSLEQCKKTTRQYVLLGEAGAIIDNSPRAAQFNPGGAWGASSTGSGQPDIRFFLCPDGANSCRAPSA